MVCITCLLMRLVFDVRRSTASSRSCAGASGPSDDCMSSRSPISFEMSWVRSILWLALVPTPC